MNSATGATAANARPYAALALLALLWGYNWVVIKLALAYIGPLDFAWLRTLLGTAVLFAVMAALRVPLKPVHVRKAVWLGLFQTGGFVGLISLAVNSGTAGKSAVLGYTMPFWVIVLGWPFLDERLRGRQWPAVGLILVGLAFVLELNTGKLPGDLTSSLLALAAGVSWGISAIIFKKIPVNGNHELLSVTAWQMLYGLVPLVVVAWLVPERAVEWSGYLFGALAFNAIGGMAIAPLLWLYILQRLPATISGLNALIVPIVGVTAAWLQLGEQPSVSEGIGMVAILAGLALLSVTGRGAAP
jgi:drug/metabolite transporter (DMT)-like permease